MLGPVTQSGTVANKYPLGRLAADATEWIRRLHSEGAGWEVLPTPSVNELYPNASNNEDAPWHVAKRPIVEELQELTQLWQVGVPGRRKAHEAGIFKWTDQQLTPELVGITGEKRSKVLSDLLAVNRESGPMVRPAHISTERDVWHRSALKPTPSPNTQVLLASGLAVIGWVIKPANVA